ncbi:unnamed protein product [Trichobilharzia szidati]|nr:unnamed protein product [Trichobilharzia szidati]
MVYSVLVLFTNSNDYICSDDEKSYFIENITRKTYEYCGLYLAHKIMEKWFLSFGHSMPTVGFMHSNNHRSK